MTTFSPPAQTWLRKSTSTPRRPDRFIDNTVAQVLKGPKRKGARTEGQPTPAPGDEDHDEDVPSSMPGGLPERGRRGAWRVSDRMVRRVACS